MMKNIKKVLKPGIILFTIIILFAKCQTDEIKHDHQDFSPFKITKINEEEYQANTNLTNQLHKIIERPVKNEVLTKSGDIYSSEHDFFVNMKYATYIESNDGNYHSYTFQVHRQNDNGLLENLFFSLQPDGTYKTMLVAYSLSEEEKIQYFSGNNIDFTGKVSSTVIEGDDLSSALLKSKTMNCIWILETWCAGGNHPGGYTASGDKCPAHRSRLIHECFSGSGGSSDDGSSTGGTSEGDDDGATTGSSGGSSGTDSSPAIDDVSSPTCVECVSFEYSSFLNDLSLEKKNWFISADNSSVRYKIENYLIEHYYSTNAINFADEIIGFFMEHNWENKVKDAVSTGIVTTAEVAHEIYLKLGAIAVKYPSSIDFINNIVDEIRDAVENVTDINPNTCTWVDLFNMWLFELGPGTINFDKSSFTTGSLQGQDFINKTRDSVLTNIQNGNYSDIAHWFPFNTNQYWNEMSNPNIVNLILGSYNVIVTITPLNGGSYMVTYTIKNTSGWDSATRFRIDNDGDGVHDGIIKNKERGQDETINLGGNLDENWSWSEIVD